MSYAISVFDPAQRVREKERARQQDSERLAKGYVSRDRLRQENGIFSSLEILKIEMIQPSGRHKG